MAKTTRSNRRIIILMATGMALMVSIALVAILIAFAIIRPSQSSTPTTNPPITLIYVIPVVASLTPSPTLAPTDTPTATPTNSPTLTPTLTPPPSRTRTPTLTATLSPNAAATTTTQSISANRIRTPISPAAFSATAASMTNTPIADSTSIVATETSIPSQSYSTLPVPPPPSDRPAAQHADLNLNLRGYAPTQAGLHLVDLQGPTDPNGLQLKSLFADNIARPIKAMYRVYNWDWGCNCRGSLIDDPEVTLIGLNATAGETLFLPAGGSDIMNDFRALVLYADAERITFKYTRSDTIVDGFGLHFEGINVDPNLLSLYQQANSAGRGNLPALRARQPFGTTKANEVKVAVRDNGAFMDPRSRKDWWR